MKQKLEARFAADNLGLRARWVLILAATCLTWNHLDRIGVPVVLGLALLSNAVATLLCRDPRSYDRHGSKLLSTLRRLDGVALCAAGFLPWMRGDNIWLLGVPILILEAVITRTSPNVIALAGIMIGTRLSTALMPGVTFIGVGPSVLFLGVTTLFGLVLSSYRSREETLQKRDKRLTAVQDCASSLVASRDLRSMMLHTLKTAVAEVGATSGYVMLLDEESGQLRTEVAYGKDGDFQFPDVLEVGSGLSGYAAKMGQPISVQENGREPLDCDGVSSEARIAVSVPLIARNYMGGGQAAVERILGAMTVLGQSSSDSVDSDDMELLRSLCSLVAGAVANARMEERQRTTFLRTLQSLATALEARDDYTRGHSQRVCEVSLMIGEKLGLTSEALEELRVGTILHDIGKIGVPDAILNKPGKLTDEEFAVMKTHPVIGYEICKPLMLSDGVLMLIRNHHEKLDGSGYPDGLKGGELPLSLRIVCVADAFDAMSSRRPYRNVMDVEKVVAELSKGAGIQFDPVVVEAFKELLSTERMVDCYRDQWGQLGEQAA